MLFGGAGIGEDIEEVTVALIGSKTTGNSKDIAKQFMDAIGADCAFGIERHSKRV